VGWRSVTSLEDDMLLDVAVCPERDAPRFWMAIECVERDAVRVPMRDAHLTTARAADVDPHPIANRERDIFVVALEAHDRRRRKRAELQRHQVHHLARRMIAVIEDGPVVTLQRSEEHTSELQSRENLVCRL